MRHLAILGAVLCAAGCEPAPKLTGVEPAEGPTSGGTQIILRGANLSSVDRVELNGALLTGLEVVSDSELTAVTPPGTGVGTLVAHSAGSQGTLEAAFTYLWPPRLSGSSPPEGPTEPGTIFTVEGTNLLQGTRAWVGETELSGVVVSSDGTRLTGVAESAIAAGSQPVRVEGVNGTSIRLDAYLAHAWSRLSMEGIDDAGWVADLVRHPISGVVYLSLAEHVFRSRDNGETWTRLETVSMPRDLALIPSEPQTVIVGGFGSVQRSDDQGQTWTAATVGVGSWEKLVHLTTRAGLVYAGSGTTVYRSADGGRSFVPVGTVPNQIFALSHDPQVGGLLMVGTADGLLWSADGGVSFTASTGLTGPVEFVSAEGIPSTVWASTYSATYLSEDGGRTFTEVDLGLGSFGAHAVTYWPGSPARWVVGTFVGILVREVGAEGWTTQFPDRARRLIVDGNGNLMVGTWSAGVVRHPRDGVGPSPRLNRGLGDPDLFSAFVDGTDGRLYVGSGSGAIWSRTPEEASWRLEAQLDWAPYFLGVAHHAHGKSLYAGQNDLWQLDVGVSDEWTQPLLYDGRAILVTPTGDSVYATRGGGAWQRDATGGWGSATLGGGGAGTAVKLALLGDDLYALVMASTGYSEFSVQHLRSGSSSWDPGGPPLEITTSSGWNTFAVSKGAYFAGRGDQVYRLPKGGTAWTLIDPEGSFIQVVAVDPFDPDVVYAAGSRIRRSTDSGATWQDADQVVGGWTGTRALALDPGRPGRVYSVIGSKVMYSQTGGR